MNDTRYNLANALTFLIAALIAARSECPDALEEIADAIECAEAAQVWADGATAPSPDEASN